MMKEKARAAAGRPKGWEVVKMGLYKKMDFWSVLDGLDKIMDYEYSGNEKDSQYWDFYSEQINEMSILAADMTDELHNIERRIFYAFPYKEIEFCNEDECRKTAIAWWNTAACMLSDTDMGALLENENIYDSDQAKEKQKRIRAFERLTKKQQLILWTDVIGFIVRYLELMSAFETINAVIRELDYHQSFVKKGDGVVVPDTAYL